MGKSDVAHLKPDRLEMSRRDHPHLFTVGAIEKDPTNRCKIKKDSFSTSGMEILTNQVAGHMNNGKTIGMLKVDGTILKPILKPVNGQTEIHFYEDVAENKDGFYTELTEFVPRYFGTKNVNFNNKEWKCIVLEDLTRNFKEPCIMDIKIGKRTWDHMASYEKIISEDNKYQGTKREMGLCIPGFLVHSISSGRICRFGKEYGRSLDTTTIKEAFKIFLNADCGLSRDLLVHFLVDLWRILRWARRQRKVRLFSSSLLLIYDAKRLKQYVSNNNINNGLPKSNSYSPCGMMAHRTAHLYKPLSLMKLNDDCPCTGFSGQFTKDGPILRTFSVKLANFAAVNNVTKSKTRHPWQKGLSSLRRVHSFQNDYDKDLQHLKENYTNVLDGLIDDDSSEIWTTVKMIDFAHAFPSERNDVDSNYLEGIENLVKLLEEFLSETVNSN